MINRCTAIVHAGVARMYRVALCATAAVALGACSLGSGSISSGFNESDSTASITSSPQAESVALGGEPKAPRAPQVAGQQYVPGRFDDEHAVWKGQQPFDLTFEPFALRTDAREEVR